MSSPRIHLCLLTGADNRVGCLRDTVRVSHHYFAAVHLIDTGSTDETESLGQLDFVNYQRLPNWRDHWPLAYAAALRDIPVNDWLLFLDSDERPSQHLLDNLYRDVLHLEASDCNCAYVPGLMHSDGRPRERATHLDTVLSHWPASDVEFCQNPCWTKRILIKRLASTYVCAQGAHCSYFQFPEKGRYLRRFYNHYKSEREVSASTVLCAWSCLEAYGIPHSAPEWQRHNELRDATGLKSANDFLSAVRSNALPDSWLEFWRTLESSQFPKLIEFWKFAFQFGFSTVVAPSYCGNICCRYSGEQL